MEELILEKFDNLPVLNPEFWREMYNEWYYGTKSQGVYLYCIYPVAYVTFT